MNQQLETEQMVQILESFLAGFREYGREHYAVLKKEIFGKRDRARLDSLRSQLRREEPQVTSIIVKVIGNSQFRLGLSGLVSTKDLLASALLGGNNELSFNFADYDATVTAAIEKTIGSLNAGIWPPEAPTPLLVIKDEELRRRCSDLLSSPGNYDRVIREATTVLEDRIRRRPPFDVLTRLIPQSADQAGDNLINQLFAPDHPVLLISSDRGRRIAFHRMLLGVVSYLRNHYHHQLDATTEWSWAWSIVGLIDQLITDIDSCTLQNV
jgi:hypothetical protein